MIMLLALWGIASASEILLYQYLPRRWRAFWAYATGILLFVAASGLLFIHALVWLPLWLLTIYHIVVLVRVARGRLSRAELQRSSMRAAMWLLFAQALLSGGSWFVVHHHNFAQYVLDGLVGLQLLAALVMVRITINTWRHTRPVFSSSHRTDKLLPSVSVLIPARNETADLEACLRCLLANDYPKLEIVVLDDCSTTRRTPEIIREFAHDGVRFIPGTVPDESRWLAKNWAYQRLAEEASGEILLFCGVDVKFDTDSVRQLVELLLDKQKEMMSILPLRSSEEQGQVSLFQPMRYFWELCLPRRFFKRPPVLSTCWVATAELIARSGGFSAVSRSVSPEAHFARQAVIGDHYSFIRANAAMGVISSKPISEQFATTIRTRYPQLHRRLELVAVTSLLELVFLVGPLLGLVFSPFLPHSIWLASLWASMLILQIVVYYIVAVRTKLNSPLIAWALYPLAVVADIAMLHISMIQYEFGTVSWKGRNVCIPVMRIEPRLPKLN
jgi:chlorobactene glucosyltransferase